MTAFQIWKINDPEGFQKLLHDDPNHLQMMEHGWSWIELEGGPRDGSKTYFHGSPTWKLLIEDKDGVRHLYVLKCGEGNLGVYDYEGVK